MLSLNMLDSVIVVTSCYLVSRNPFLVSNYSLIFILITSVVFEYRYLFSLSLQICTVTEIERKNRQFRCVNQYEN